MQQVVKRDSEIDWYSFLQRPRLPVATSGSLEKFCHASILITGAGGSIGSGLSLRLAATQPKELVLLDASEQALHRLRLILDSMPHVTRPRLILGNAGDAALLTEIFETHKPQFIFHTAAYKHVSLLEEHPLAAIENNALNTLALAELGSRSKGARIVLLSTDKAVEPVSVLGATKRIAELAITAHGGVALRLGNVLGTEGSVSEIFIRQIISGGPITFTGKEHRRYFMTREESVDLLLLAAIKAPDGAILAAAIDRQYSVASLAEFLLARLSPGQRIAMLEAGPRSGDKPCEKLWSAKEDADLIERRGYFQLKKLDASIRYECIVDEMQLLRAAVVRRDRIGSIEIVRKLVPDYVPSSDLAHGLMSGISSRVAGARQS